VLGAGQDASAIAPEHEERDLAPGVFIGAVLLVLWARASTPVAVPSAQPVSA